MFDPKCDNRFCSNWQISKNGFDGNCRYGMVLCKYAQESNGLAVANSLRAGMVDEECLT